MLHDAALAKDELYTSDPYVLVQYYDKQAKESKMAVYTGAGGRPQGRSKSRYRRENGPAF